MELFLPIAEMSVPWLLLIGLGFAIGFLSGMFGIGGGFLLTPALMFCGIPPSVAVATGTCQLTGVSVSGLLANAERRTVDYQLGGVMVAGGALGSLLGVGLFGWLQRLGQIETAISLSYVILLGSVGTLMLAESWRTLRGKGEAPADKRRAGQHRWIDRLPFKQRFHQSKLYTSILPPAFLGMVIGLLSASLGVGGGFLLVPAMIYLLRVPTAVAIGTSMFQILFTSAFSTVFQAAGNYSVDIVLAVLLILGGVAGAQYGVRFGAKLRGVQLRFLLALLIVAMAGKLAFDLVVTPADLFHVQVVP